MTTKFSKKEVKEAREHLLSILKPGDTVYCNLRHVSSSGMYRVISMHVSKGERIVDISWYASKLLEGWDDKHGGGCKASGCGMDMGFGLVYNLGRTLWPNGYTCTGDNWDDHYCQSNDHSNAPYPVRDGTMHHNDGGYALQYRWL